MFPESAKGRGHLAELIVATEATKRGFTVCWPGGDNCAFDLVLMAPSGKFYRVQVKSSIQHEAGRNRYTYTVKRGGRTTARAYTENDIDILALLAHDSGEIYLVPVKEIDGKKSIKIQEGGPFSQHKDNWDQFI